MQPGSPGRQKLAKLPVPALEALLGDPALKAASENSAIAAVTFWLEQQGGQMLTVKQKRRLACRLRLLHATPFHLTGILANSTHWLQDTLNPGYKVMLTAMVQNPLANWGDLQALGSAAMNHFSGQSGRPASSIRAAELLVEISPGELWEKRGAPVAKESQAYFWNGIIWTVQVKLSQAEGGFQFGAFVSFNSYGPPVAFTGDVEMVAFAPTDTLKMQVAPRVLWRRSCGWGFANMLGTTCISLEDATAKLARFIHPDGKLHIKGTVTGVH
jgi:hypothetical protein